MNLKVIFINLLMQFYAYKINLVLAEFKSSKHFLTMIIVIMSYTPIIINLFCTNYLFKNLIKLNVWVIIFSGYRGLVNQAMTCYLNSLLQALYMTPEFRNALYKWKFDFNANIDGSKSIPFQLQKLFLNLQVITLFSHLYIKLYVLK